MSKRPIGYDEKEEVRIVYDNSSGCCLPQFVRHIPPYGKIGDYVHQYELIYDECYNLINILYTENPAPCVNNLDIRIPEKAIITSATEFQVDGTCGTGATGEIVQDGDTVVIIDIDKKDTNTNNLKRNISNKILGQGSIAANAFSVSIDVSSYSFGETIGIAVLVYNHRVEKHGTSQVSLVNHIVKS